MQLLKITTVPIKLEMKIEKPRLEMKRKEPSVEINRTPANLRIRSRNTTVELSTKNMRHSMGQRDVFQLTADQAQEGAAAALEATAQYTEIGNQMAKAYQGVSVADILYSSFYRGYTTQMAFLPSAGPEIDWQPASLDLRYDPARLHMEWNILQNTMQYHPGKFSLEVVQYPRVDIEYLGGFMYVPPSAEPGYEEES